MQPNEVYVVCKDQNEFKCSKNNGIDTVCFTRKQYFLQAPEISKEIKKTEG